MIGEMLRRFRREKKLSQAELSEKLNIVQTHVSRIERGIAMPSVEVLIHLVKTLEIPSSELLEAMGLPSELADEKSGCRAVKKAAPASAGMLDEALELLFESIPELDEKQRERIRNCLADQREIARLRGKLCAMRATFSAESCGDDT